MLRRSALFELAQVVFRSLGQLLLLRTLLLLLLLLLQRHIAISDLYSVQPTGQSSHRGRQGFMAITKLQSSSSSM